MTMMRAAFLSLLLMSGTAMAQDRQESQPPMAEQGAREGEKPRDDTVKKAGDIATQPVRDVGIEKTKIPPVLQRAVEEPYAMPAPASCRAITASMADLTEALGPDFGSGRENNENRTGKIVEAGGQTLVNSLIPFRGLVREISGAAPAQRRLEAAISTGIARRGFLRGLAKAKGCKLPD
jgi:hypothetical protein